MNAHLLGIHQGGGNLSIDNYFEYCRSELPRYLPGWEFRATRPGESTGADGTAPRSRTKERLENYIGWPLRLRSLRADLFHIVDQNVAWYSPFLTNGHKVITVHDLINIMVLRKHLALNAMSTAMALKVRLCVENMKRATALVCVSQNTADCAVRELGVSSSKIFVVHNMIPADFTPVSPEEKSLARSAIYGTAEVALLHVGKPSLYKNRTGVLKTFEQVKKRYPGARLVVTNTPLSALELSVLEDPTTGNSISLQVPQTRAELRLLYGAADVFVFPSLYEGFGWPPIEAMACGCPVVCSTTGSLTEVVGQGAITVSDAQDHHAFARAVIRLLQEQALAKQMISQGFQNAARFASDVVTPHLAAVYSAVA